MKQNTDIEKLKYKSPFRVPDNYFSQLKSDIHKQSENLNFNSKLLEYFNLKIIAPVFVLTSLSLIIILNTIINLESNSESFLSDEIYVEIVDFEIENIDEEYLFEFFTEEDYAFSNEIEYLIDNNTEYDLIIE